MAVTSKTLRSTPRSASRIQVMPPVRLMFYGVSLLLVTVAAAVLVNQAAQRLRVAVDDLRYGRPRTMQLTGYVQHGESAGQPTHLMALNLNRQVAIIELPGGDASKARTIMGPYLFGADEDLTPVHLALQDMDADGVADLLVEVRQEQIVYLNREGAFRLPTAEEQARLRQDHHP